MTLKWLSDEAVSLIGEPSVHKVARAERSDVQERI